MQWWQDDENYVESYKRGKLYIVDEINTPRCPVHRIMFSSGFYRCTLTHDKEDGFSVSIHSNPNAAEYFNKKNWCYPSAHYSKSTGRFEIYHQLNKVSTEMITFNIQAYKMLEYTIEQVLKYMNEYEFMIDDEFTIK